MQDIRIENLSKTFEEKHVLNRFSAVFPAGRPSCIMAPSGYGKTTLLRILMGLEKPDEGTVQGMEGVRISAVFQEDRLCENLNAEANIRLVNRKLKPQAVKEALEIFGLSESLHQPVCEFSGGMKRRVALLRALLAEYDLLILDEPFKGFDEELKQNLISYTMAKSQGKTVLLVTHDAKEAEMFGAPVLRMDEAM